MVQRIFFVIVFMLSNVGNSLLALACAMEGPSPRAEISVAPNAPKDRPISTTGYEMTKLEEAIKPYLEKAKETYPDAKRRYLAGLQPSDIFFVTTKLQDADGNGEQVFVRVSRIRKNTIYGTIASQILLVSGYANGDEYKFPESNLVDWVFAKPDGTEEGNFVGKFLDEYQDQR